MLTIEKLSREKLNIVTQETIGELLTSGNLMHQQISHYSSRINNSALYKVPTACEDSIEQIASTIGIRETEGELSKAIVGNTAENTQMPLICNYLSLYNIDMVE